MAALSARPASSHASGRPARDGPVTGHRSHGLGAAQDVVVTTELGDPIRRTVFSDRVWRPAVRPAGLSGMALCSLRHLCASLLIGHGESVES